MSNNKKKKRTTKFGRLIGKLERRQRRRESFIYHYNKHCRSTSPSSQAWLHEVEGEILSGAIAWFVEACIESHFDKVWVSDFASSRGQLDGLDPKSLHAWVFWRRFLDVLGLPDHHEYDPLPLNEQTFQLAHAALGHYGASVHYRPDPIKVSVWLSPPNEDLKHGSRGKKPTAPRPPAPLQGPGENPKSTPNAPQAPSPEAA